jgi:AcrR family transcriptional regulator
MSRTGRIGRDGLEKGIKMSKGSIDRRVARTRSGLHQALMSLVLKKGYAPTTVEDICETADVGRSTFYAHYAGKDDLMRSGLSHLRQVLVAHRPGGTEERFGFSLPVFDYARQHLALYRAHGQGDGALAIATIRGIIADGVRAELAAFPPEDGWDEAAREIGVEYLTGAFMAMLTGWLNRGAEVPPERMAALFRRMATQGVPGSAASARRSPAARSDQANPA